MAVEYTSRPFAPNEAANLAFGAGSQCPSVSWRVTSILLKSGFQYFQ